jgi:hypothetical protein
VETRVAEFSFFLFFLSFQAGSQIFQSNKSAWGQEDRTVPVGWMNSILQAKKLKKNGPSS